MRGLRYLLEVPREQGIITRPGPGFSRMIIIRSAMGFVSGCNQGCREFERRVVRPQLETFLNQRMAVSVTRHAVDAFPTAARNLALPAAQYRFMELPPE